MKTEVKHTPTPWIVSEYPMGYGIERVEDSKNCPVRGSVAFIDRIVGSASYPDQAKANAGFILRAVNAHEALIEAAKAGEYLGDKLGAGIELPPAMIAEKLRIIRAAIAKAEGRP